MKQKKIAAFAVQEVLAEKNIKIFTAGEFSRIFKVSPVKTKYFLESHAKKNFLIRLKRGIYAVKNNQPGEEEIANFLYRPSYISFEYALAKHNILPEMVYAITSATTKSTRVFSADARNFQYFKIKKEAFAGYSLIEEKGKKYLLADPEKALADYLYFVALGKKSKNERLQIKNLDKKKIISYARLYKRPGLLGLVENL